ncbi:MAG: thioredoxin family protein [Kofleriaceae bacterium]
MQIRLIDFTAAWCGPCRQLKPVIEQLKAEYGAKLHVDVIDVEEDRAAAEKYGVRVMPTIVLERDGQIVGHTTGARPQKFLKGMIDRALNGEVAIASP